MSTKLKTKPKEYANISSEIEFVTPAMAQEILSKNTTNRNFIKSRIGYYKHMIEQNQWDVNGESIKIAKDGTLLDGQHRLEAISQSGIGIYTLVVRGLDKEAFVTIDTGKPRTHGDVLKINGYEGNEKLLAASARIAMFFDENGIWRKSGKGGRNTVSPQDIMYYIEKHPGVVDSIDRVPSNMSKFLPPAILIGCHYIFSIIDAEKADEFVQKLYSGASLKTGDAILALRNRLISMRGDNRAGEGHRRMIVYYVVHTWNAFMKQRSLQEIKYQADYEIKIDNFKEHVRSNWN